MAAPNTITSANAVAVLSQSDLYPAGVTLVGWATDKAWSSEAIQQAETMMGVDGRMSAGYTPASTPMTLSVQADSPSVTVFDNLIQTTESQGDVLWLDLVITVPGIGKRFTFANGILTNPKQMPDGQKVLQSQDHKLMFESMTVSPL